MGSEPIRTDMVSEKFLLNAGLAWNPLLYSHYVEIASNVVGLSDKEQISTLAGIKFETFKLEQCD